MLELCLCLRRAMRLHGLVRGGLLALAAGVTAGALAQGLPRPVVQALARAQVPPAAVSMLVVELGSGRIRVAHRVSEPMNPASVTKLVTTAAALELLGPQHTWTTTVLADGEIDGGMLTGRLVVRGGGDPKLVIERLQALVAQVHASGIKSVKGDIVIDRSLFRPAGVHPGDFDGEPLKPYNTQADALLVNFQSLVISLTPDAAQGRALVKVEPAVAGMQVDASVPLATGQPCQDWRGGLKASIEQPLRLQFAGSYPLSCGERSWPTAYPEPARFAERVIEAAWRGQGGGLSGRVREATADELATLQARGSLSGARPRLKLEAPSVPLADVVHDVNKFSNNVMAQHLFYTLGLRSTAADAPPGTLEAGRAVVLDWWRQALPAHLPPVLGNGSGLNRAERITAQALGELLQRMADGPRAAELQASLPVAGVDATMRQRAANVAGRAWLKTGSLRDVSAIAGYAQGAAGQRYAVVGMVNHPNASAGRAALDALVQWAVQNQGAGRAGMTAAKDSRP
jgi:D-alanyl-D-alanine carboxypeptidase/D-alanyl-D-alanine-endopeptidase (penicillin-binding protein 4)